jgi:hypothetical protein
MFTRTTTVATVIGESVDFVPYLLATKLVSVWVQRFRTSVTLTALAGVHYCIPGNKFKGLS